MDGLGGSARANFDGLGEMQNDFLRVGAQELSGRAKEGVVQDKVPTLGRASNQSASALGHSTEEVVVARGGSIDKGS